MKCQNMQRWYVAYSDWAASAINNIQTYLKLFTKYVSNVLLNSFGLSLVAIKGTTTGKKSH